jgi:toxin ParE1/3/4
VAKLEVSLQAQAIADLEALYDHKAQDSPDRAIAFIRRIRERCERLSEMPRAGRTRDDLRIGLRLVAFERRVVIAYALREDRLDILRVLYRGRDVEALLSEAEGDPCGRHASHADLPRPPLPAAEKSRFGSWQAAC